MTNRYVCIHGHFYQPPRENPWLEAIELQDSAYPYHDWNERITAECYGPNAAARILDGEGFIQQIVNNYSRISFNFGPTLIEWLEAKAPDVYRAILAADEESRKRFSGHGSAIAQAYNHMIMPLANRRDKETQVVWGIRDFERRFGRKPEGMWLPETAADIESLSILAEHGITFTILAPTQARRVRALGSRNWRDASGGKVDPTTPYLVRLPAGRSITAFFYDGPISRAVAFEGLLQRGEALANRLLGVFPDTQERPQLAHIATDGETYGHHHHYGDMALAYALHCIEANDQVKLTNYGEFLEMNPPALEAKIVQNSSWSCVHGVERWRSDCGCNSGMHAGWHQAWRTPLREAFDWLRDSVNSTFLSKAEQVFKAPWLARNNYIDVVLDRSKESIEHFLHEQATRELSENEAIEALKLMEVQRHLMLMYTSCGWFFDELSGIETVQTIQYAGRAIQLAGELFKECFENRFLEILEKAESNIPENRDGRVVFEKFVKPAAIDIPKVGAHYAISSLFEPYNHEIHIYCYTVDRQEHKLLQQGKMRLVLGRAKVSSDITWESALLSYGVLHLGDQNITGGVREFQGNEDFQSMVKEVTEAFERGELSEELRVVEQKFGSGTYTLKLLFRDQQHHIMEIILQSALAEAEASYRQVYERGAPLIRFIANLGMAQPRQFKVAAEFTLNGELQRLLAMEDLDVDRINALLDETRRGGTPLDEPTLEFAIRRNVERIANQFAGHPERRDLLHRFEIAAGVAAQLPFQVRLWNPQNAFYEVMSQQYPTFKSNAEAGNETAQGWLKSFLELGSQLKVRVA